MHGHMRQYCDQLQCGQWYAVVECGVEKVTKVPGKCMIFFLREEFTPMLSSTVESFRCAYWCLSTFEPIRRHVSRCQCQCYLFRVYLTLWHRMFKAPVMFTTVTLTKSGRFLLGNCIHSVGNKIARSNRQIIPRHLNTTFCLNSVWMPLVFFRLFWVWSKWHRIVYLCIYYYY